MDEKDRKQIQISESSIFFVNHFPVFITAFDQIANKFHRKN